MYKHVSARALVSDCAEVLALAHTSFGLSIIQPFPISVNYGFANIDIAPFQWKNRQLEQMHKQVAAYYGCEIQKEGPVPDPPRPGSVICFQENPGRIFDTSLLEDPCDTV